jgi:hypothetical protein
MKLSANAVALLLFMYPCLATAQSPQAKVVAYHGYQKAVELTRDNARAVLCPEVGGRVLEFSVGGKNAMWLDPAEAQWQPSKPRQASAGRIDIGPEMTTPRHEKLWSGEWTAEITGESSARLTSQRDEATGVQLVRDFELASKAPTTGRGSNDFKAPTSGRGPCLLVKQTIINISSEPREYCHWGRSFSPGGGICLIPLAGKSRFPSKYALYEDGGIINVKATDPNIRERDGFLEILAPPRKPKLGFDSYAGWLAYLMPDGTLFIKRFATYPDRVYNEAAGLTISVWYPPGDRIELEPIGPRERLQPGQSASFTEEWSLASFSYPKEGEQIDLARLKMLVESAK